MTATYIGKVESSALWNNLSIDQRYALELWLFDERVSYREAWQRARIRWNFRGTVGSIYQFYRVKAHERRMAAAAAHRELRQTAPFTAFQHLFETASSSRG